MTFTDLRLENWRRFIAEVREVTQSAGVVVITRGYVVTLRVNGDGVVPTNCLSAIDAIGDRYGYYLGVSPAGDVLRLEGSQ